ncbi:MAG: hypothetical protein Kow0069_20190 [Promethearchaeota archaeon]
MSGEPPKPESGATGGAETGAVIGQESGEGEFYRKYRGSYDLVSYARPLGGWFYQFFFAILGAALLAVTTGLILAYVYPFPESKGYNEVADRIFLVLSFVFNVPTAFAIERFIGEWRVKDPRKMVEFVRFYIWYQMLTGIGLVTVMSLYTFRMLQTTNTAFATWMILVVASREYPAMTGIFLANIKGLQQFHYESVINFINDTIIRPGFELGCVLAGKAWGATHPAYGELMGIAIGYAVGTYVDDFFSMALAAAYFRKALRPMGFTLTDCLTPRVSWDVIKTSLSFGFKVSIPGIFGSFVGFTTYFWWYELVPAFLTFSQLNKLADDVANLTKRAEGINIKASISEAYNNGKRALTQYYIAQSWKFYGFFTWGISAVVIGFLPALVTNVLFAFGAENYLLAVPFILPNILHTLWEMPNGTADHVILGANRPLFKSLLDVASTFMGFFFTWLWLVALQLPQRFGTVAVIWLLPMGGFPVTVFLVLAKWWYVHKKIVPVRLPTWQAFVAPAAPFAIVLGLGAAWSFLVAPALVAAVGHLVTGLATVMFAFVGALMFTFIPLYTFFGGWDEYGLRVFKDAVDLSGPAKVFFKPIYKLSAWLANVSPLHDRHPIPWRGAAADAEELMRERELHDAQVKGADAQP